MAWTRVSKAVFLLVDDSSRDAVTREHPNTDSERRFCPCSSTGGGGGVLRLTYGSVPTDGNKMQMYSNTFSSGAPASVFFSFFFLDCAHPLSGPPHPLVLPRLTSSKKKFFKKAGKVDGKDGGARKEREE